MSNLVTINTFDGGIAEDVRTTATNQCESSVNFDILTNPHKLLPYSDPVAETHAGTVTDYTITDVAVVDVSGTETIYGMGRHASGSQDVAIFKKNSTTDITASWTAEVATNANDLTPGTLVEYKNFLWYMSGGSTFSKFAPPSTISNVATLAGPYTTNFSPRPFRHPIDDTLYMASGNLVYKFDNVVYTTPTATYTLATNFEVQSFTDYGNYLAMGGKYLSKHKKSAVYLGDRDITTSLKPQQVIDWGEGSLMILENVGGVLVGISYTENIGSYTTATRYKMYIKTYSGGSVQTVKEIITGSTENLRIWKAKSGDRLYFGFNGDDALYVLGKNKSGYWAVTKDRYINPTGSTITGASGKLTGVSLLGDIMFTSYGDGTTDGYLTRQGTGTAYTLPSRYFTTVNPNMPLADRTKKKTLMEIRLSYTCSSTNGTANVYVYNNGGSSKLALTKTQTAVGEYLTTAFKYNDSTNFDESIELKFMLETTGNVSIKEFKYIHLGFVLLYLLFVELPYV